MRDRDERDSLTELIEWKPSIYVPGIGVIYLTLEQVKDIIKRKEHSKDHRG